MVNFENLSIEEVNIIGAGLSCLRDKNIQSIESLTQKLMQQYTNQTQEQNNGENPSTETRQENCESSDTEDDPSASS